MRTIQMKVRGWLLMGPALLLMILVMYRLLHSQPADPEQDNQGQPARNPLQEGLAAAKIPLQETQTKVVEIKLTKEDMARMEEFDKGYTDTKSAHCSAACPSCAVYNMTFDKEDSFRCVYIELDQSVHVPYCLGEFDEEDQVRYRNVLGSQKPQIEVFMDALKRDPYMMVIDVGVHTSLWTLTAGVMGHKVITLEDNDYSLKKLKMAASIGEVKKTLLVLRNPVSDKREVVDNPACPSCQATKSLILNDIVIASEGFPSRVFLFLEIKSRAHHVFNLNSFDLFKNRYIRYVVIKFADLRHLCNKRHQGEDSDQVAEMIGGLITHNYTPHEFNPEGKELNPAKCASWPEDVLWVHVSVAFRKKHTTPDMKINTKPTKKSHPPRELKVPIGIARTY